MISCRLTTAGNNGPQKKRRTEVAGDVGANYCITMFDWSDCSEVSASPETVSGAFVFRGTRVPVKALFENLEDGATVADFLEWFPGVNREQVDAVLEFAAHSLEPAVAG
jgi:uncharacterized protein (DUF433 family)